MPFSDVLCWVAVVLIFKFQCAVIVDTPLNFFYLIKYMVCIPLQVCFEKYLPCVSLKLSLCPVIYGADSFYW